METGNAGMWGRPLRRRHRRRRRRRRREFYFYCGRNGVSTARSVPIFV
jgi:hypothetical protein